MHIPQKPPKLNFSGLKPEMITKILDLKPVDPKGRYLHWDEMKRHNPPDGIDHKLWWFGTKIARLKTSQATPFKDIYSNPFIYCEPSTLRRNLMLIDKQAAGNLGTSKAAPNQQDGRTYLTRSLVEEPFHSSLIEGAATTRDKAKELIYENKAPRTKDERMVLNNYLGLGFVKQHLNELLTVPFILELHEIITGETLDDPNDAGRIRQRDDIVVETSTGEVLHIPPKHKELANRLQKICDFANKDIDDHEFHHPIIRAIILHFMLAYDHPFVDGNGRTARALFYWSVLRSGYWLLEYISISSVIAEAKIKYGRAFLKTETDEADLTYFLLHQLDVILIALDRLHNYIEQKKEEISQFEEMISRSGRGAPFNHRQTKILHDLVRGRSHAFTIADYRKIYNISYLTARNDLEELVEKGLLSKKKQGQTSIYVGQNNIRTRIKSASK